MRSDCDRLADAIADGRFLEDPAHWRDHVESCEVCRLHVEGLFELRERVERAGLEVDVPPRGTGPLRVQGALSRFHRRRATRRTTLGCVLLAFAVGVLVLSGRETPVPEDPVVRAKRLFAAVFPGSGSANALLRENPGVRAEYLQALDDPSSLVRRTALQALALSGVEIDPARLSKALTDVREDLESPLALASLSDGAREVASALNLRRKETVKAALAAAFTQASRNGGRVPALNVIPFLTDSDPSIRREALTALGADPSFIPGEEVLNLMRTDLDLDVRIEAVQCLVDRTGAEGAVLVVNHLRKARDTSLEQAVVPLLGRYPAALPFARERAEARTTPVELALAHQLVIVRAGERSPPEDLVERALFLRTPGVLRVLSLLATEGNWVQYRDGLQEAWKSRTPSEVADAGVQLASWDLKSRDPRRLQLALDICERVRGTPARRLVQRIAQEGDDRSRERAETLLRSWPTK